MDTGIHFEQYRASLLQDAFPGFREYVESATLGGSPAIQTLKAAVDHAIGGIRASKASAYWEGVTLHQKAMLDLHQNWAAETLPLHKTDAFGVLDFVHAHGWRRLRFSDRLLHMQMNFGGTRWIWSILPNYRRENIDKLKDFLCFEENHIAFEAAEMEALMLHADKAQLLTVMEEKRGALATERHILWGSKSAPEFRRISIGSTNSAFHIRDWALPLRS